MTLMNLLFLGVMLLTSIAATVFGALSISLSAFEVRHLLPLFLSLCFQLLAVIGFQVYRIGHTNFEVYKENSVLRG